MTYPAIHLTVDYFCPPIPTVLHATHNGDNDGRAQGTEVLYECDHGYRPVVGTSSTLHCSWMISRWEPELDLLMPACEGKVMSIFTFLLELICIFSQPLWLGSITSARWFNHSLVYHDKRLIYSVCSSTNFFTGRDFLLAPNMYHREADSMSEPYLLNIANQKFNNERQSSIRNKCTV